MRAPAGGLLAQRVALLDAEAVLLVDHDEPQVGELHVLLEQRVRADDDAGRPRGRVEQGLAARLGPLRAGQQGDARGVLGAAELPGLGERPEHRDDRAVVLLGQHLGRREQGRLPARVDHLEHRAQAHDRLARADVALEQPVHRVGAGQVGRDLVADGALALGELERKPLVERGEQALGGRWPGVAASSAAARLRWASAVCSTNASSHLSRLRARPASAMSRGRWMPR